MILCRLDYWLIFNNLHDLTTSTDIIPAIKTDHSANSLELNNTDNQIKGPGIWKMNCALLEDDRYVDDFKLSETGASITDCVILADLNSMMCHINFVHKSFC